MAGAQECLQEVICSTVISPAATPCPPCSACHPWASTGPSCPPQLPSQAIEALSMCRGLSTSDKVVFVSLAFHIKDKGQSLAVLTIDTWWKGTLGKQLLSWSLLYQCISQYLRQDPLSPGYTMRTKCSDKGRAQARAYRKCALVHSYHTLHPQHTLTGAYLLIHTHIDTH